MANYDDPISTVTGQPYPNYVDKFKAIDFLKMAAREGMNYLKENAIGKGDPGAMGSPGAWIDKNDPNYQESIYADKPMEMKAAEIPDLLHASPHKFEKFAMDNMGRGEGIQAFGWGLYFSDSKAVNRHYLKKFGRQITIPQKAYEDAFADMLPNWDKLDSVVADIYKKQSEAVLELSKVHPGKKPGELYQQYWKTNPKEDTLARLAEIFEDDTSSTMAKRELESLNLKHLDEIDQEYGTNTYEVIKGLKDKMKKGAYNYEVTLHKGKQPSEYSYLKWYDKPKKDQVKKIEEALKKKGVPEKVSEIPEDVLSMSQEDIDKFLGSDIEELLYWKDVDDKGLDLIFEINEKTKAFVETKRRRPGAAFADLTDPEDIVISSFDNLEEQSAGQIKDAIHLFKIYKKQLDPKLVKDLEPLVHDLSKTEVIKKDLYDTKTIYDNLTALFGGGSEGQREASLFLKDAGIDGIEYPARSLSGRASKTEKNYVIFDADAAHIERRSNGKLR